MAKAVATMLVAVLLVAAMGAGGVAAAPQQQRCDAGELAVCAPAVVSGAAATAACCHSLHAHQRCFCEYARNPAYGRYINPRNALRHHHPALLVLGTAPCPN